ncbi:TetR/AcrR family transcriptional regulator [Sphaerochaeta pleomorpha]|nr:TetR/AcrR family transcriptional regulator [Sphaerochaeta pleomorpha]
MILTIKTFLVKRIITLPKALSEHERTAIRIRLKEEGKICLGLYGLKKTTVDELVKRTQIPKGTFYLFYASKELLFFEILMDLHDSLQQSLLSQVQEKGRTVGCEELTDLLYNLFREIEKTFLPSFLASGDLELLMRKLPPEIAREHMKKDDFSVGQLLDLLSIETTKEMIEVFSVALRAIFTSLLHKQEIGEEHFNDAVKMMLRGIVSQLF